MKRRYPAAFLAKLSDAEAEAAETEVWLDIAARCGYITQENRAAIEKNYEFILGKLVNMMSNPEQWTIRTVREERDGYDAEN